MHDRAAVERVFAVWARDAVQAEQVAEDRRLSCEDIPVESVGHLLARDQHETPFLEPKLRASLYFGYTRYQLIMGVGSRSLLARRTHCVAVFDVWREARPRVQDVRTCFHSGAE